MTSLCASFSPLPCLPTASIKAASPPTVSLRPACFFRPPKPRPPTAASFVRRWSSIFSLANDITSSTLDFGDLSEKDWSFLEPDFSKPEQEHADNACRAIAAAEVGEKSRVLVSFGSELFVDQLVDEGPCELLVVVHDSLFNLAMIKEKHDHVRCWQGPLVDVPGEFSPFDIVFLCYLPAVGVPLHELLKSLAGCCSPGARVVINSAHGREVVEQVHRKQYPDIVTADLPDKVTLENAAAEYAFELTQYMDDPTAFLAVLKFHGTSLH